MRCASLKVALNAGTSAIKSRAHNDFIFKAFEIA
jgi:hypothetical protein